MKVLVLWVHPTAPNFGLRVLAAGSENLLKMALAPEKRSTVDIDFQDFTEGELGVAFGGRGILRDLATGGKYIGSLFSKYDLIIDTGAGDSYTSLYGRKRFGYILYARLAAAWRRVPLLMGPQTLGPFGSSMMRFIAKMGLVGAHTVISRDSTSAKYSLNQLGREVDIAGTDVVFGLPDTTPNGSYDVLLNVSGLLWFDGIPNIRDTYRAETIKLVKLLTSAGRSVTLLPHVIGSQISQDDVAASEEVCAEDVDSELVALIIPASLEEMRGVISGATVLVGARMHACLNALSQGVPAIPWAYSRKFAPLMHDIGWEYVVDLNDDQAPADATTAFILDGEAFTELRHTAIEVQGRGRDRFRTTADALTPILNELVASSRV